VFVANIIKKRTPLKMDGVVGKGGGGVTRSLELGGKGGGQQSFSPDVPHPTAISQRTRKKK